MCNSTVPTIPPLRSVPLPGYTPDHRADVAPDSQSQAACTGGLVNAYGKRLVNCRSTYCPRHKSAAYADAMARHATDSL